jgi:hypothetical protein
MAVLTSPLFSGDEVLQRIADDVGGERISRTQNSVGPPVTKVQQALLMWRPDVLPESGADGEYGSETAAAVVRFKVEELGVPEFQVIPDVGPRTVIRLDEIASATPVVTSVSPASGGSGGGTTLVITGSGFNGVTAIRFGTQPVGSFSVDSDTQITAEVPSAGEVDVIVTTDAAESAPGPGATFTYT